MANKRMFNVTVLDSDAFLDMPLSAQALYFHLNLRADDDGFIGNPKRIQRLVGASEDDLKLLIAKAFLIVFENGVVVVKHWRMHNAIRKDRYTITNYTDELKRLGMKENKSYTLNQNEMIERCIPCGNQMATNGLPSVIQTVATDIDIGLDIDKDIDIDLSKPKKPTKHKYGEYHHVLLDDNQYERLKKLYGDSLDEHIRILDEYIETSGKKYKNHSIVIQKWVHERYLKDHRNNKHVQLDSKFYAQESNQTQEEIEKEMERVRKEILGNVA